MAIITDTIKYSNGKETTIMRESLAKGKKILLAEGYVECPNSLFMQKYNSIIHYNKTMKVWIVEEI
jgi:hypothetical protein